MPRGSCRAWFEVPTQRRRCEAPSLILADFAPNQLAGEGSLPTSGYMADTGRRVVRAGKVLIDFAGCQRDGRRARRPATRSGFPMASGSSIVDDFDAVLDG